MTLLVLCIILFPGGALLWGIITYNRFVRQRQLVKEGWSGIDVQLKRRADLIPNIVETVKGYAGHERQVMEQVASLRNGPDATGSVAQREAAETSLTRSLKTLFAIAEAYPELKADTQFLTLQRTLTDIEEQIQYARRYYNGTVRDLNILVQSFPSNLLATLWHYQPEAYFELELVTERSAPRVDV